MNLTPNHLLDYPMIDPGKDRVCLTLPDGRVIHGNVRSSFLSRISLPRRGQPAVYVISAVHSDLIYAGSTGCIYTRVCHHRSSLRAKQHRNRNLQAINDSAPDDKSLMITIFEMDDRETAFDVEQILIVLLTKVGRLANVAPNARSPAGIKRTDDVRARLSEIARKRTVPDHVRARISATLKGRPVSEKRAKELGELSRKIRQDPEFVARWRAKKYRPVEIEGVVYESLSAAAKAFGISAGRVLDRIKRTSEKFTGWKYHEPTTARV